MTKHEFKKLFLANVRKAITGAQKRLDLSLSEEFDIELHGGGFGGKIVPLDRVIDILWISEDQFNGQNLFTWFPPHVHPTAARVFVLNGVLLLGEGEVEDHNKVRRVKAGDVVLVPGNLPHYEGSDGDTIIIGITTSPFSTRFLEKR